MIEDHFGEDVAARYDDTLGPMAEPDVLDRTVDSHVRKLRARLQAPGDEVIETVHGVGYRIGACLG